jgi:hypothetical protein
MRPNGAPEKKRFERLTPDSWSGVTRPVRVSCVVLAVRRPFPLYPDKQTTSGQVGTSHLCQERKSRFMVQVSEQRLSDPHNTILRRYSETHRRAVSHCIEEALAEIELANSFSAASAGPPTSPPEARQRPGTT